MFVLKGAVMPYILYIRALICFCVIFIIRSNPPPYYSLYLVVTNRNGERGKSNSQRKTGTGNRELEKWEQSRELENRLLRDFCGCPILSQLSMCKKLQFMNCIICFGVKERRVRWSFVFVRGGYSVFRSFFLERGFGI